MDIVASGVRESRVRGEVEINLRSRLQPRNAAEEGREQRTRIVLLMLEILAQSNPLAPRHAASHSANEEER